MSRLGNALLWFGGFGLAALMAYTVAFDLLRGEGRAPGRSGLVAAEVAVFYPERVLWQELRQGIGVCAQRGLLEIVDDGDAAVVVRTPRNQRTVRFRLHDVRGLRETRDEVERLLRLSPAPLAVIGSSNTVLTEAIAEALRASAGSDVGHGPVLLIPWASAVLSDLGEPGEGPIALLGIDPGRTFRFCLNNQYQADLLVRCVAAYDPGLPPAKAVMVEDRFDPYSVDLASSFHRAVAKVAPEAEISEPSDALTGPVLRNRSSRTIPEEDVLAETIRREAEAVPGGRPTWVFLPLQEEPTERLLLALRRHSTRSLGPERSPLRVVCGDAVGVQTLARLAGQCPFPVWSISSSSASTLGPGISTDVQIPAEMVAALVHALDLPANVPLDATRLRDALASLRLRPGDRGSLGRSLAFSRSGERAGDDLGHVLMIRPGRSEVFSVTQGAAGTLNPPEVLPANAEAASP